MKPSPSYAGRVVAGKYLLIDRLGEGAMASVYRATRDEEPKEIAVKIMHQELRTLAKFSRRFMREAKAASKLKHPNTAKIFDFGEDGDLAFIAMELLDGRDLFDVMKAETRLDVGRAVHVMKQICQAVAEAQHFGIVHRDLKAENIMLVPDPRDFWGEQVKVLDFGIAKVIEPEHGGPVEDMVTNFTGSALTQVGSVLGTPEYMAPEQCRGERVDFRTDVYSAGVLLFLMVTGELPFTADLPATIMIKHVREAPPKPTSLVPELPAELEAVILKALEKEPADRYQHANEMYWALSALEERMSDPGGEPALLSIDDTVADVGPPIEQLPILPPGGLPPPSSRAPELGFPSPTSAVQAYQVAGPASAPVGPVSGVVPSMRHSLPPLDPHPEGPLSASSPWNTPPDGVAIPASQPVPSSLPLTPPPMGAAHAGPPLPGSAPVPGSAEAAARSRTMLLVFVGTLIAVSVLTAIVLVLVL